MGLPDFAANNFRWKLTALLLAMLAWFAIKFAIYQGVTGRQQVLRHQIVLVLDAPEDPRMFRVQPPYVDVTVQADKELQDGDLEVFVNVSGMPVEVDSAFKEVLVRGKDVAKVISVEPGAFVRVERLTPSNSALAAPLRKP
jgi:hypothetical protein